MKFENPLQYETVKNFNMWLEVALECNVCNICKRTNTRIETTDVITKFVLRYA